MESNIDLLMFLVSAIISIIIVVWMASSNNKIGNYGVGENDPPTTNPPRLPGTRTVNCSPPEGSKPPEPRNQYGISTRVPESRDKTIPPYMDYDIKPSKEETTKYINKVCGCGCKNVDVMSVVKRPVEVDEKEFNVVDITYICTDCGNMKTEAEYLYER